MSVSPTLTAAVLMVRAVIPTDRTHVHVNLDIRETERYALVSHFNLRFTHLCTSELHFITEPAFMGVKIV